MRAVSAVVVLAWLALPSRAQGNCDPGRLDLEQAWPADRSTGVPTNTRILVHRYGTTVFLGRPVAYRLVPERGAPIELRVSIDLHSGSAAMQQRTLVLEPMRPLAPRTRYTVFLAGPEPDRPRPQTFVTGAGADAVPPTLRSAARARSFQRVAFGCGPADTLSIGLDASDDGPPPWVRLRVARSAAALAAGHVEGEMILVVEAGQVTFGHEMCIGNWPLDPGDRFAARLVLMDAAGHERDAGTVVLDASR